MDLINEISKKHDRMQSVVEGMIGTYSVLFNEDPVTGVYKNCIVYHNYQQMLGGLFMLYNMFGQDFLKHVEVADAAGYNRATSYLDTILENSHD